jgi:hypothetical protein
MHNDSTFFPSRSQKSVQLRIDGAVESCAASTGSRVIWVSQPSEKTMVKPFFSIFLFWERCSLNADPYRLATPAWYNLGLVMLGQLAALKPLKYFA